jgi:peptidyl-prolyl cis-trans isomerase SurA
MFGVRCFVKALLLAQLGYVALVPAAAQTQINNLGSSRSNVTAPQKTTAATSTQEADAIVAVVNKDVITRRELDTRVQQIKTDLARQRAQIPPDEILQSQLLQRLIIERLQVQEAKRQNLEVNDQVLKTALDAIAQRNKMTPAQLRSQIEGAGVAWADYSEMIKREVLVERLRQRVVDSTMLITDAEVDAFLREQKARQTGGLLSTAPAPVVTAPPPPPKPKAAPIQPAVMGLAQILVRVPEDSTEDEVKVLRAKAQALLARLRKGESFEALAKASSEGPEASRGGDMGGRLVKDWPDLFLKATAGVADGQLSNIIQSGNGFHILKVLGRAGGAPPPEPVAQQAPPPPAPGAGVPAPQGPMMVEQTRARHILIKTTAVVTSDIAKQKLDQVRERIVDGKESFSDLAKRFSNDSSAPQGGGLGWLNPGETVPPFEQAMKKLKIGEVSEPVQTSFGWHLIVVDERRTQDMAEQFQRNQVRQRLFLQRSEASFETWLQHVRNSSFIDNRLEKSQRQGKD